MDDIISAIDNILKIDVAKDIEYENIDAIEENLFRISWRSSEIPIEICFKPDSPLTERSWIILDYLSNALVQIHNNISIKQEFFKRIKDDLCTLKDGLVVNVSNKNYQINLPIIDNFVSFFLDQYLLYQMTDNLRKIVDAKGKQSFPKFLQDEQVCYGIFRVIEILGESFKNMSSNLLELFTENITTVFRELRNAIQHNRFKLELTIKYNKGTLKNITKESCKMLCPLENVLAKLKASSMENYTSFGLIENLVTNSEKININFNSIKDLTKILNTKNSLSTAEIKKLLDCTDEQDRSIIEKIIFQLEKKRNFLETEDIDEIFKSLKGEYDNETKEVIYEFIWKTDHKIPITDYRNVKKTILESLQSFDVEKFKSKLIARIENLDKEAGKHIISYNEILNSLKKIKIHSRQDEVYLKKIIKAYVMNDATFHKLIDEMNSINEIIVNTPMTLHNLFEHLTMLQQKSSTQISIIKKFYYKKIIFDKQYEVLSYIENVYPMSFDINQFTDVYCYKEKLQNLSKLSSIFKTCGDENVAEKISILSDAFEKSKRNLKFKLKFNKNIDNLRKESNYLNIFHELDLKNTINDVMEYIDSIIIERPFKKERMNFENIRTFYLWKCLEDEMVVQNFLLQLIKENSNMLKNIHVSKDKLKAWIQTGELRDAWFVDEMLCNLEKIHFSCNGTKENLKCFIDILSMSSDEDANLSQDILKLKADKGFENIFTSLEKQDSLEKLVKQFKILEKHEFEEMDKIEKVLLRYFIDKKLEDVTKFINGIVMQHPADILNKIIVTEQIKNQNFLLLAKKLVFDHTKEYEYNKSGTESRERDFNQTNKLFSQIFSYLKQSQIGTKTCQNINLSDEDASKVTEITISKLLTKIKKLENTFSSLINGNMPMSSKGLIKLSAQYLLEDIGMSAKYFIKSKHFKDFGYLSISKRQFLILNIARKTMAHYPMYISDEKLEFYVKQLVLDSMFRLQQLENEQLNSNISSSRLVDFSLRRNISFTELKEKTTLIKCIILGNGFSDTFIAFNKEMGCDIGVQGDIDFVISSETRNTFLVPENIKKIGSICELELELSYELNCNVNVYDLFTTKHGFFNKLTEKHQRKIETFEIFDSFLITKMYEEIYNDNSWTKAVIPNRGNVYNINLKPTIEEFVTATEVEYIFNEKSKIQQTANIKQFRLDRIKKVSEIQNIIRYKAATYAHKVCQCLNDIKENIGENNFKKLLEMAVLDRYFFLEISNFFVQNEYEIKAKFPKLFKETNVSFVNYANKNPEEFFFRFPNLYNFKILKENRQAVIESLSGPLENKVIAIKDYIGVIISQFHGIDIVNYIQNNINHILRMNNHWLLVPAAFANLKDKYCNDDVTFIINEELILLDFHNEVEYAYSQKQNETKQQLKSENINIFNRIFANDMSLLEEQLDSNCTSLESEYTYKVPDVFNGILGFASELDPELRQHHFHIGSGNNNTRCMPIKPDLVVENFIDIAYKIAHKSTIIDSYPVVHITYRFEFGLNILKQLLELHRGHSHATCDMCQNLLHFEESVKKAINYYNFIGIFNQFNAVTCRINKCIQKDKNLRELISENSNSNIQHLKQQETNMTKRIIQQDYENKETLIKQIYCLSYVKERIIKVLQNPFELQNIMDFVQCTHQENDVVLNKIINDAISAIKCFIKEELVANSDAGKAAYNTLHGTGAIWDLDIRIENNATCNTSAFTCVSNVTFDNLTVAEHLENVLLQFRSF